MGVVNTSYTFTATDTITSAKMNNIIDDTIMTGTAVSGNTLQVTPSGQLAVNSQGITSNELAAAAVTQAKIGTNIAGTGPFFGAVVTTQQNYSAGSGDNKATLFEENDTNNNFANSRFTSTIAGYYMIVGSTSGAIQAGTTAFSMHSIISKNGSRAALGAFVGGSGASSYISPVSAILYLGVGEYVELFHYQSSNINGSYLVPNDRGSYIMGCLIRAA